MAGVASGGSGDSRAYSVISSEHDSEALAQWRSSQQLESGTPSTSPPFWDTDDDDDDGLSPSQLYGTHTWKITKYSQNNKRELRGDIFEAGGYKWYILVYPQGCDVCNHLSLFLCVAEHDKLLPGWSHFAQFTIAVMNKDNRKSKYSDTLHRFWKKEHDWGWKKFMELSKVSDGFIMDDTLTIKAQVQVIREKPDRPFRCLECEYRKILVRVYLTNVEQICRRFVEERRSTFGKLIEDKARWSSFCAFWLGIDQKSRRSMTRERTDTILRVVVKQFFIDKEVTSTLVMDSLYSGLKALEKQTKIKKGRRKLIGSEEFPIPIVQIDQDMFFLVDDVLLLLERASLEPLPPKDEKGPQNRMKDGSSGEDCSNEPVDRDLRRLTELGRRTIEIFVLDHIFRGKIEVAYQEAIALERQEELIREEAAWLETEQKSKRCASEKEKKLKKKQGKQKKNNRKGKEKGRDDNAISNALEKLDLEIHNESKDLIADETKSEQERAEIFEDVSDLSDTVDRVTEVLHLDAEERESRGGGGASALFPLQNGEINGSYTAVDDSSSTCSTDSVPSMVTNGVFKANSPVPYQEIRRSPNREKNQRDRTTSDIGCVNEGGIRPSDVRRDVGTQNSSSGSRKAESEPKAASESLQDKLKKVEPQAAVKKQPVPHRPEQSIKDEAVNHKHPKEKTIIPPLSSIATSKHTLSPKITAPAAKISIKSSLTKSTDVAASSRSEPQKSISPSKLNENHHLIQEIPSIISRPASAPIVPGPRPNTPIAPMAQPQPLLSRSVSAVDPTSMTHHHQSYRNAMMGTTNTLSPQTSTSSGYPYPIPVSNSMYPHTPPIRNDAHAPDIFEQLGPPFRDIFPAKNNGFLGDEFPHLDIINDLLDDENSGSRYPDPHFLYPRDVNMNNDMLLGPSTSSSRFQRTHSYQDNVYGRCYGSFPGPYEPTMRDFFPQQINMGAFSNGQMADGLIPNQWQAARSDLSYPYHIPDYSNISNNIPDYSNISNNIPDYSNQAGNLNGYAVFRPSSGL